jgi:DNA repair exonuclease SbcCD nuclease subunit
MAADARRFTFLQFSDVHLDSHALATGFPLTPALRRQREKELLESVVRAFEEAKERQVDAVLIAGDLWHNQTVRAATISTVIETCRSLGDIPVLVSPGNRDFYSPESPYSIDAQDLRGLPRWPENVHIFKLDQFNTVRHPRRPDVCITGRAFTSENVNNNRLLSVQIPRGDGDINILLFHGALEGYSGNDIESPGKMTAPFSVAELKAQNFTYAALGHYHDATEVRHDTGLLLGAYSGCLAGRSFYETGPRSALFGAIEPGRPGRWNVTLEPVEVDKRHLIMVASDITGLNTDDMLAEILLNVEEHGGRPDTDIFFLHLEGTYDPASNPARMLEQMREQFPCLVVYDNTRPDYLSEAPKQDSTEYKFVESLLELKRRIERARAEGQTDTLLSGKIVEDAVFYGLNVLKQQRITIRNVD